MQPVTTKRVGYEVVCIMSSLHYACLVEAGDVLYDAGDSTLHGEVAEIVAEYSIQSEARRSFLHHSMTVSYLLDMAIVFVLVSNGDTDTRLIFLVLEEMKRKFRDVDRPLHFEETLKSILKTYNVNLNDTSNENVKKIRDRMAQMPTIQKETIEMAVPIEELDELGRPSPPESIDLPQPPLPSEIRHTTNSKTITAVLLVTFVCVTLFLALIVWSFESRPHATSPTPNFNTPNDNPSYPTYIPS